MKKKTFLFFAIDVRLKRQSTSAAIFGGLTLSSGWPFFSVIDLVHNSYKQSHQLNPWSNKLQWIALNEIAHPCLDLVLLCVNAGVKFGKDLLMVAKKNVWHQFTPSPFNPPPYPSSLTCTSLAMMFMIPPTPSCTGFLYCTYLCCHLVYSPQAALDWFAMKRFYDDSLGGVTQPSQRRSVIYKQIVNTYVCDYKIFLLLIISV